MEMEVILPKKKVQALLKSPRKLAIYAKPKSGKTTIFAQLKDSLILDFEKGSDYVDAVKCSINSLEELKAVGTEILKQGKPYKIGIVDTVTKLEDMCGSLALQIYRTTPMGKSFTGDNVLSLPNGAGYLYLREAFSKITTYIESLFEYVIYSAHIKTKFIEKNGKEVSAQELDLTGKIKSMLSSDVDAIGMMYRSGKQNIITFKGSDDIICGARPAHLKNKEIIISELQDDGSIVVNWDKIYID